MSCLEIRIDCGDITGVRASRLWQDEAMTDQTGDTSGPRVTHLLTTPIKGFGLCSADRVVIDKNGAVGDRDFFIVDENRDLFSITRSGAFAGWHASFDSDAGVLTVVAADGLTFEDDVVAGEQAVFDFWESREVAGHFVQGRWSSWLSAQAGRPVQLVRTTEPGDAFDESAVTVVAEESVREIGRIATPGLLDLRRFRMLINIAGVRAFEEESWRGDLLGIGSATLRMGGPVPRCNATTRNPDTGKKDVKTLQLIAETRGMQPNEFGEGLNLGAYAQVVEPGAVNVGDRVSVVLG